MPELTPQVASTFKRQIIAPKRRIENDIDFLEDDLKTNRYAVCEEFWATGTTDAEGGTRRNKTRDEEVNARSRDRSAYLSSDLFSALADHIRKEKFSRIFCLLLFIVVLGITIAAAISDNFGTPASTGDGMPSSYVDRCHSC
jgi:hypothetical protein